jgi:hypothetical protein
MRLTRALIVLLLAAWLPAADDWAQGMSRVPTMTRLVRVFLDHEEALLRAQRAGSATEFDRLLADDFELVVARRPGDAVSREDWLAAIARGPVRDWAFEQMAVHDHGDLAVVSFLMRPPADAAGALPVFVVDAWGRAGDGWQLKTRYAAPVPGTGTVPGEPTGAAAAAPIDKKI